MKNGSDKLLRAIDTIKWSMNTLEHRQQKTASNIANANTTGYKFQDMLQRTSEERNIINYSGGKNNNQLQELGSLNLRNEIDTISRNITQASLKETGRDLDFALGGEGFFTVLLGDGSLGFTRNGNFKKDSNNNLLTIEGNPVIGLDRNGNNIQLNIIDDRQDINFLIADFDNYDNMNYIGDNIFENDNYIPIDGFVERGFLEMSNVNLADEMIKMIENLREFQANQKMMHTVDETLSKAVNEIGKV